MMKVLGAATADFYIVMPGLDPGIHDEMPHTPKDRMDCRVKPGNDEIRAGGFCPRQ